MVKVIDGAMGTVLQKLDIHKRYFLGYDKVFEVLNISYKDIIMDIHKRYIESGADIIETNTFNCNIFSLNNEDKDFDYTLIYKICKRGGYIAREVAKNYKDVLVAGSIGPTHIMLSQDDSKKDEMEQSLVMQISGLIDSKVDFLLFETVYDFQNLKLALKVYEKLSTTFPLVISFTCDENGNIYSGENIKEIIRKIDRDYIIGYGINCVGKNEFIKKMRGITSKKIFFYPNDGIKKSCDIDDFFKSLVYEKCVDVVGGCCGTDFSFIEEISKLVK